MLRRVGEEEGISGCGSERGKVMVRAMRKEVRGRKGGAEGVSVREGSG